MKSFRTWSSDHNGGGAWAPPAVHLCRCLSLSSSFYCPSSVRYIWEEHLLSLCDKQDVPPDGGNSSTCWPQKHLAPPLQLQLFLQSDPAVDEQHSFTLTVLLRSGFNISDLEIWDHLSCFKHNLLSPCLRTCLFCLSWNIWVPALNFLPPELFPSSLTN